MIPLSEYSKVVGQGAIDDLRLMARHLHGRSIQNINSTAVGGGVAEILSRMVPLMQELGVNATWDVIRGDERFFVITKKFHNALHGVAVDFAQEEFDYFLDVNRQNAAMIDFGELVFVHDPQPVALIQFRPGDSGHWAWRCHIDFSRPNRKLWHFLEQYVSQYEAAVFSAPAFARALTIPQVLISPSIDPLSEKNRDLSAEEVNKVFTQFGIDRTRPVVTQISRFDYLKDPVGVIKAYRAARKRVDCQLVLAGGGAVDDPEGPAIMAQVQAEAEKDPDIHVLFLPPSSDLAINALQRGSTIVLQKSLREGFGLTVAEALWKRRPVIASAVGGIPLQISHRYSGILTHSIDGTAHWIKQLINEPAFATRLGENGRLHILNNYLITRHIKDYLLLFLSTIHTGDVVSLT
jgi:trehalose synthase